jgi:meckelin
MLSDQTISGKSYTASKYKCQYCPDPYMTMSYASSAYTCSCSVSYTKVGLSTVGEESCVLTSLASTFTGKASTAYVVSFGSVSVSSIIFQHYFIKSAARCTYYGGPADIQQCQTLANLCVLQMYDSSSDACDAFISAVEARTTTINDINNFVKGMPWLYIAGSSTSYSTCTSTTFKSRASLNQQALYYLLSTYTMNGTFVGFQRLETVLQYCGENAPRSKKGGGTSSSTGWQYFGASEVSSYSCNLTTLTTKEQYFYELFLYDSKMSSYHPIPVRIRQLESNNEYPNKQIPTYLCDDGDVLVRRFFLYDVVSSLSSSSSSKPSYIRYASEIRFDISLTSIQSANIFPPVLSLQYKYHSTSDAGIAVTSPNMVSYYFKSYYRMPMDYFTTTLTVLSCYHYYHYNRYNDFKLFVEFFHSWLCIYGITLRCKVD